MREIAKQADANLAAISYHFGSKDALYHEVLKLVVSALTEASLLDEASIDAVSREEAVRLFIRQQVAPLETLGMSESLGGVPLSKRGQLARYLRILAWETVAPTRVYLDFVVGGKMSIANHAEKIVRRFLPHSATPSEVAVAAMWLAQQVIPFIRHYDTLSKPPLNLKIDRAFIEKLSTDLACMVVAGLTARAER